MAGLEASVVGVGMTELSRRSGRSELRLAAEAIVAALEDAGLSLQDVDGLVTYDVDSSDPLTVLRTMGLGGLRWFSRTPYGGGGACATVQDAAVAITSGLAEVVVVYRAANMRSGLRFGQVNAPQTMPSFMAGEALYGGVTPAQRGSLWFHRYLHDYGLTNADLAPVAIAARSYAATNPNAHFYERPLTFEEHQESDWVVEPVLRRADCCLETDAGAALVVTSAARARDLVLRPARLLAAARGMASQSSIVADYHRDGPSRLADLEVVARALWEQSDLTPSDIDVAILYDSFSPLVPMSLEALGFCGPGEGSQMVAAGLIGPGGALPVNPNGGQLAEGYVHGFNGLVEAVRQIRGSAVNQVEAVSRVVVTSGPALPTSALILEG